MKIKKLPITGYSNVYVVKEKRLFYDSTTNKEMIREEEKYELGDFYENKNDVPNYYEISCSTCKHVGIAKVTIEVEEVDLKKINKPVSNEKL